MIKMKKINIMASIILTFLTILCNPVYTKATTTATVYLEANRDIIEKGEEVEVSFNIKDEKTASYFVTIYFDETKFDLITEPENGSIEGNKIKLLWYDSKGGSGAKKSELGKLKFKAKDEGTANFVIDGEFYTEKGQLIQTKFETLQVQIGKEETILEKQAKEEQGSNTQSNNANLQVLRLNIEGMVPSFQTDVYDYDLTVENSVNDIEVLAVTENPNAQIKITGNNGLKQGVNTITIKTISEDKTQEKNYKIKVTKTPNLELANTNLEILAIENILLNPPFENSITKYNVQISNETTKLNIFAVPENEQGKVEIKGNDNLKEGNNVITITVTAPNGITKRDYIINAYKRNLEEEEKYKKEQEENKEKLEEAYEIEKTSMETKSESEENNKTKNNYMIISVIGIIAIIVAVIGGIYYKKKYLDKKYR